MKLPKTKKKEKPDILKAFFSMNMWHIWSVYGEGSYPIYYTAKNESELFNKMSDLGFEMFAATEKYYFFKKTNA